MKNIIFVFAFLLLTMLLNQFELPVAIAAFLISAISVAAVWHKVEMFFLLREYASQVENIYVVSNDPATNEEVFIEALQELIVNIEFNEVVNEVANQKQLLQKSGNEHFNDKDLQEHEKLQVLSFTFQDAEYINETFFEFELRVAEGIKEDRIKRHAVLKNADPVWYDQFCNYQNGVQWNK